MRRISGLRLVSIVLVLSMGLTAASASFGQGYEPNNVGEILKGNKFEWLIGEWEATTDANEKAEAKFELSLDGYALSIRARVGRYGYAGLAYYVASKNTIVNTGVDTRGRSFGGSWLIDGDKLLLKLEQTGRDGSIENYERYLSKVDADTMKSVTYSVIEGKRSDEPIGVLEFKRKK